MAQFVKFFRGPKANYVASSTHLDAIYFAVDTKELLVNNVAYGFSTLDAAAQETMIKGYVKSVTFDGVSKFTFTDGNGNNTEHTIPVASATSNGLMSKEHFAKLEALPTNDSLNTQINAIAQSVADEADRASKAEAANKALIDANAEAIAKNKEDIATLLGTEEGGQGGTINDRIDAAKSEIIGTASEGYKTLGEVETKLKAEEQARSEADTTHTNNIAAINTELGDKSSATIAATSVWGAIEELESEASTANQGLTDKIGQVESKVDGFIAQKGVANGLASLDENGLILSSQLPSYVDDVIEGANLSSFPAQGEESKIYVALDTNKTYRWSGSQYTEISASLALGETAGTAYEGSKGKANADAIAAHVADLENPHQVTKEQVGLGKVENMAPSEMPVSTAVQAELDKKLSIESFNSEKSTLSAATQKVADDLALEVTARTNADSALELKIQKNTDDISTINNKLSVIQGSGDGSIAKSLADAKAYADGLMTWTVYQ